MGFVKPFEFEKLVVGIMYTDKKLYKEALKEICSLFGSIDTQSDEYCFSSFSTYYNNEMKGEVMKRFVSMTELVDPSTLANIKIITNQIEEKYSIRNQRRINIDPCLLSHGKFIMATTKGASFRIPLINGIFADLSLVYARNHWVDFFWTYFDVKSEMIKQYLAQVRQVYLSQRIHQ